MHPKEHFLAWTQHHQPGLYRIVSLASQRVHVARGDEFQIWASLHEKGRNVENDSQIYGIWMWARHHASFVFWMDDAPWLPQNLTGSGGTLVEDSEAAVVARSPLEALLAYEMVVL